jgi:cation diffusion facilitator CzcD-associated flavoprotein CzcO
MSKTAVLSAAGEAVAQTVDVCVIGAGFSGLGMAIQLLREGKRTFVVLEKAAAVGGTWRENTYPGCACDVSSQLYSFSFAPKPDWSRMFPTQPEIRAYLEECTDRFGVRRHIRFNAQVLRASYRDARTESHPWQITTADGHQIYAKALVLGMGGLHHPALPAWPGRDCFRGASFHSALWQHDVDLTDKTVAVIGTGASAIQFIPKIQPRVRNLLLYQRTPPWIIAKPDFAVPKSAIRLFAKAPLTQKAARLAVWSRNELLGLAFYKSQLSFVGERLARSHLAAQVADPALRKRLTPDYRVGCKRVLISNDYYPAVTQPNVTLISETVREVVPDGIVSEDGTRRFADVIIYGTGFRTMDILSPAEILGRDGRSLNADWNGSPEAFLGITVAGYPNLFLLMGPNTGLGHNSMIYMIESQIAYVMSALQTLERKGARTLEPKLDVQRAFNARLQTRLQSTVWESGCKSWYKGGGGKNYAIWPGPTLEYRLRTRHVNDADNTFL